MQVSFCLWALDQLQGLTGDFAASIEDLRYIRHQIQEMETQRSFRLLPGYEDCNNTNSLRFDPVFKAVSQPPRREGPPKIILLFPLQIGEKLKFIHNPG